MKIEFYNTITNEKDNIDLVYPNVDYTYWSHSLFCRNDLEIKNILNDILIDIDCTRELNGKRICSTNYPIYKRYFSDYYFYIIKLVNQLTYNEYINKLIKRHIDNLIFEYNNPIIISIKNSTRLANKYQRHITNDLITGELIYYYHNPKTKDSFYSNNGDLLESLNKPKSKRKKKENIKKSIVSMKAMKFNFKIK